MLSGVAARSPAQPWHICTSADIKLTKDGNSLLREMQITNPTALMIARTAVAQDDVTGDGTTSTVLLIGELLKQSERYLQEGLHPRLVVEGFDASKEATLKFLESFAQDASADDRDLLQCVARTALGTKLPAGLADYMSGAVTDAVLCIKQPDRPLDLHMVEIMHMKHKLDRVRLAGPLSMYTHLPPALPPALAHLIAKGAASVVALSACLIISPAS